MNINQAKKVIKDTFENPFKKEQFVKFVQDLLNSIDPESSFGFRQGQFIPEKFRDFVSKYERVGKYINGETRIDILIVYLNRKTSIDRARSSQRNFIAEFLQGKFGGVNEKEAALVAYVSPGDEDWRFSLVKMDYKFEETKTGKMKVKEEFTPARRWSFLVGENEKSHTAQSRLVKILADDNRNPTLKDLEDAFNIETVTKEFFLKYRELFLSTKEELDKIVETNPKVKKDFAVNGVDTVNFAKKLLGQIIFLYFLQKKGWFGVGRDDDWGTGSQQFLRELFEGKHGRYKNFFNDILEPLFYEALRIDRSHDDDYYSRFNCKIPFLNGGLFDPIGNYDWVHTDINLPNDLFSNTRQTKEGDVGDGILDVFDRYNFTVREDEPLEKEVAIDPELLGKAYEKFNAIRPDNFEEFTKALKSGKTGEENKFNKKFGVYYTPREIVHYMCKQSLINYLYTKVTQASLPVEITKQDIEDLIEVGELITEHEAIALIKEQNIKKGIQKSTEYTALLPDSIRRNAAAFDQWLAEITVCDPAVGSGAFPVGMMNEIVRARNVLSVFLNNQEHNDYDFKRCCIEHSLYGVDIDPGAVEIAKLRLWLSLVVDEEDIKNIKPLPNLDYKIVCGNSLLGVEKNLFNLQLFEELEKLKPLFFSETNPRQKKEYKKQIDDLISQITNGHKDFDFEVYFSEVFHEKGGFDIVIANPPYILIQNLKLDKSIYRRLVSSFYCAQYKVDTYHLFFELGIRLLKSNGIISFITPNAFLRNKHTSKLREIIVKNTYIHDLILFYVKVFEDPSVDNIVIICQKMGGILLKYYHEIHIHEIHSSHFDNDIKQFRSILQEEIIAPEYNFKIDVSKDDKNILNKIEQKCKRLGQVCGTYFGIQTFDRKKFVAKYRLNKYYKPVIDGGNISRYFILNPNEYVDYQPENIKSGGDEHIYKKERIVVRQIGRYPEGAICEPGILTLNTIYNIYITTDNFDIKYVLAIINSKLIKYYWLKCYYDHKETFPKIKKQPLESIPIKDIKLCSQKPLISLVDTIFSFTESNDYLQNHQKQARVKELEGEIDQLVYELYGLTEEEIKIVEGN